VIELRVNEDSLVDRLLARGRADDIEAVIRKRQRVYRSETTPLLHYYDDILVSVDGVGEVDEVTDRVLAGLRGQRPHPVRTSATPGRHPLLPARPRP
jgi:adenylate kinase